MGIDWLASCERDDSSIYASLNYESIIEIDTIVIAEYGFSSFAVYGFSSFHVCDEMMHQIGIRDHKRSQIY